jgi:3-methyladenine DNA glycosylase/8-oxoguanine DNA glycosylase
MQIKIAAPPNFSFQRTVLSHGWCVLPPFEFDRENWKLTRVIDLGEAKPVTTTISAAKPGLLVETSRVVGKRASEKIVRDVRHMFRLDDDLSSLLFNCCRRTGLFLDWGGRRGPFTCARPMFLRIW